MSLIDKLASATKSLTPEQKNRVSQNVEAFVKAAETDPAFLEEALEKVAGMEDLWQQVKPSLINTGAAVGGTLLLTALGRATNSVYEDVKNSRNKAKYYKAMLTENPDLAKLPAKRTQAIFNTLHTLNPVYAGDPLVAGSFIRNTEEMERFDVGSLKHLSEGYRAHQQAKGDGALGGAFNPAGIMTNLMAGPPTSEMADAETLSRRAAMQKAHQDLQSAGHNQPLADRPFAPLKV